jgi:putative membrane protein
MLNALSFLWHWNIFPASVILLLCLLYVSGMSRLRQRSTDIVERTPLRLLAFAVAILAMVLLLVTPIDSIARTQLFMLHMAQVIVLTTLCAPLLLFAAPPGLLHPLLESQQPRAVVRLLTRPLVASVLFNGLFLFWHLPFIFTVASEVPPLYHLELLSLLGAALLNWWPLIGPLPELRTLSYPAQMLYAFLDGQPVDIFAFLLVFSGTVLYPHYVVPASVGISALSDQEAAGAMLLVPGLVDLLVMTPLFFRWLASLEEKARLRDIQLQQMLEAQDAASSHASSPRES